jgi:hypothetical protein
MATVQVRNLLAPDEDSTASMGNLEPIEFVAGLATMDEEAARELHFASPQFVIEEPPEGDTRSGKATKAAPAAKEETPAKEESKAQ